MLMVRNTHNETIKDWVSSGQVCQNTDLDKKSKYFKTYNEKVDIWSLGVMTYMFLTGAIPFSGKTKNDIEESILLKNVSFSKDLFGDTS